MGWDEWKPKHMRKGYRVSQDFLCSLKNGLFLKNIYFKQSKFTKLKIF